MDDLFVKPGNQDRGWNDPPQFSYGLQQAGSTRSPLTSRGPRPAAAGHQTPPPPDQQTPPPLGVSAPPGPGSSCPSTLHSAPPPPKGGPCLRSRPPPAPQSSALSDLQAEPDLQAVSSVLAQALQACRQDVSRQVCEDIAKRLRLLEDSWRSGRLSSTVMRRMNALTLEMRSAHWDLADDIHRSLMVDHVTEVSQWMVGIKRLIAETRKLNPELLAVSWSDSVQPCPVVEN